MGTREEISRNHNPKAVSVQKAPMDYPLPFPHPGPWREKVQPRTSPWKNQQKKGGFFGGGSCTILERDFPSNHATLQIS